MPVELNPHHRRGLGQEGCAEFLAMLGLRVGPSPVRTFPAAETSNGVTLDFVDSDADPITSRSTTRSWCPRRSSGRDLRRGSSRLGSPTMPIPGTGGPARSITTMAAGAPTSADPNGTT